MTGTAQLIRGDCLLAMEGGLDANGKEQSAPVLKWAGGKRQLLGEIKALMPGDIGAYCEPFLGGGALLFDVRPGRALASDANPQLMEAYAVIRDDVEGLIAELSKLGNDPETFYEVRGWDRDRGKFGRLPPVRRAARLIYLNRTCFNGLFRVNSRGEFNAPFGKYSNPSIVNASRLRAVSSYLRQAGVRLRSGDFAEALEELPRGAFAYLDPPYDPAPGTASFTSYTKEGFSRAEQARLRRCCDDLDKRGIRFLLSNSGTDFIRELYSGYAITTVRARRAINPIGGKRGPVDEVLVRNYRN